MHNERIDCGGTLRQTSANSAARVVQAQEFPQYGRDERLVDFGIHVIGVSGSIVGCAVLLQIALRSSSVHPIAVYVYAFGLIAMFSFSAAYHIASAPNLKRLMRRFDHAAIYLLIAATYTPIVLGKMSDHNGFTLLWIVWCIAAFGVVNKLLIPHRFVATSYALYLIEGWAGIAFINSLAKAISSEMLALLGAGGVLYTIGVGFFFWRSLRFHNAIWHGFVLIGSACCYAAVMKVLQQ